MSWDEKMGTELGKKRQASIQEGKTLRYPVVVTGGSWKAGTHVIDIGGIGRRPHTKPKKGRPTK